MNFFHTQKLFLLTFVSIFALCITGCSSDDDDDKEQEQEMYEKYITAEVEEVLKTLEMKIHRGVNPPNIQGHFLFYPTCMKSTREDDLNLGVTTANYYISLFDQTALNVRFLGYEATSAMVQHAADGTFITGEGDKFTIYFEEKVKSGAYTMTVLSLMSGEVARGDKGEVVGFNNFQYVFYMKDNDKNPSTMPNNSARLCEDKNEAAINLIAKEEFDAIANRYSKAVKFETANAKRSIFSIAE